MYPLLVEHIAPETGGPAHRAPIHEGLMHSQIPLVGEASAGVIPLGYEHYHAGQIATAISLGALSVGDRLPSETELANQFGVAVATIRKSLAELREAGLVETLRGRSGGTFVVRVPFPTDDQVRQYLSGISIVNLRDFGDERVTISRGIARFATQRAQKSAIETMRSAAEKLIEAKEPSALASHYSKFHTEVALAAQSPRLLRTQMWLLSEISTLLWSPGGAGLVPDDVSRDHEEMLDALAARDVDHAQQTIERHVQDGVYRLIDVKLTLQNHPDVE